MFCRFFIDRPIFAAVISIVITLVGAIALVQLPLGLNLPAGAKLQVDDGKTTDLQIQTCEARGCYANLPITPDVLATMRTGKQLKVYFQNLGKETIAIPMPLADFASAYDKIK